LESKGDGKKGKKGKKDKDKGGRKGAGKAGDKGYGAGGGGGPFGGGNKGRDPSPLSRATQQHAESVVHWGEDSPITKALAQRVDELTVEKFKQKPVASLWDEANGEVRRLEVLLAELDQKLVEARQVVDIISGEKAVVMGSLRKAVERRDQCRVAAATELRGVDPSANKALEDADALLAKLKDGLEKKLPLDPTVALAKISELQTQLALAKGNPAPTSPSKRSFEEAKGTGDAEVDVDMQLKAEEAAAAALAVGGGAGVTAPGTPCL